MIKRLKSYIRQREIDKITSVYRLKEKVNGNMTLTDALAVERTILADERTLLAYVRTAIASAISGATVYEFFGKSFITRSFSWFLLLLSFLIVVRGVYRYARLRRIIPFKES